MNSQPHLIYQPLDHNLAQGIYEHLIVCALEHRNTTNGVPYTALSYAWESGSGEKLILGTSH